MGIALSKSEINWFANEYTDGRTIEEMATDTGFSRQNVKRALAEAGICNLSWYKTNEENQMLEYLRSKDINTLDSLTKHI